MKILVVSDNHFDQSGLKKALNRYQDCDLYIHCGDSNMSPEELKPFAAVKGNNDFDKGLPKYRVIDTPKHSFYVTHGHYEYCDYDEMGLKARMTGCDTVLYGHTHIFDDTEVNGIRFINPGSISYNRDGTNPCFALIYINDATGDMYVERIDVKNI